MRTCCTAALGGLVLQVAPGRSDLAAATVSAAVGITGGALVGGLAVPGYGVHSTVLIGALLGTGALVLALSVRLIPPTGIAT